MRLREAVTPWVAFGDEDLFRGYASSKAEASIWYFVDLADLQLLWVTELDLNLVVSQPYFGHKHNGG